MTYQNLLNRNYNPISDRDLKPQIRADLLQMIEIYATVDKVAPTQIIRVCTEYFQYLRENALKQLLGGSQYDEVDVEELCMEEADLELQK